MEITIYHNPRCSKSRKTLELIEEAGIDPTIVRYLDSPPSAATVLRLSALLGVRVEELLRKGESGFSEAGNLPPLDDDSALAAWLHRHPQVLQRPIVVDETHGKAVIGRPPENVLALLRP
jgi:arsenate reductase